MHVDNVLISPNLVARVLAKLGLDAVPEIDLQGLSALYYAWCRSVPFDNSLKMMAVKLNASGALPGSTAEEFFENWLRFGSGGTCWSGNGALCTLLRTLGFDAQYGLATMLVAPNLPPNHGTVVVESDGAQYLVDASILHSTPLLLDETKTPYSSEKDKPWGVHVSYENDRFYIRFHPLHMPDGLVCRLDSADSSQNEFHEHYQSTRAWSPFNYELNVRLIKENSVVGIANNKRIEIDANSQFQHRVLSIAERIETLHELGFQPELAEKIPADSPTPPPPGSKTAERQHSAHPHE